MTDLQPYGDKKIELHRRMDEVTNDNVVIAFSGGVDSSLLVKLACMYAAPKKKTVYAVTISSELQPAMDAPIAATVAAEAGAIHRIIYTNELSSAGIGNNPKDRCYLCKKYLFSRLKEFAAGEGITAILEGTNEDDLHVYRPGLRAIRELGIESPLANVGLTKEQVRKMAQELGISVAKRPSMPCLATRFPYGTELTLEKLKKVEDGENYVRSLGFRNVRLRVHGDIVRIEVDRETLGSLVVQQEAVTAYLKAVGYKYITLDLEGFRSGSMDE